MSNSDREEDVKRSLKETSERQWHIHISQTQLAPPVFLELHIRDSTSTAPYMREALCRSCRKSLLDACHNASDRRWIFRSQLAQVKGTAVYI